MTSGFDTAKCNLVVPLHHSNLRKLGAGGVNSICHHLGSDVTRLGFSLSCPVCWTILSYYCCTAVVSSLWRTLMLLL